MPSSCPIGPTYLSAAQTTAAASAWRSISRRRRSAKPSCGAPSFKCRAASQSHLSWGSVWGSSRTSAAASTMSLNPVPFRAAASASRCRCLGLVEIAAWQCATCLFHWQLRVVHVAGMHIFALIPNMQVVARAARSADLGGSNQCLFSLLMRRTSRLKEKRRGRAGTAGSCPPLRYSGYAAR